MVPEEEEDDHYSGLVRQLSGANLLEVEVRAQCRMAVVAKLCALPVLLERTGH